MTKIVIDARELRTGSGRYVERMLHYLQHIDNTHDYAVLLTPKDFPGWQPVNVRFTKIKCPYKEFTFSEQLQMYRQITNMHADLVHFPFVQQPILYRGNTVTTIQDLTTARFRNPTKNWLIFTVKQQVYRFVNWYVARKTRWLITPSEFVKKDIARFAGISESKITVTYEAATALPRPAKPLPYLERKKFIMYVGRPLPHKNLWRLIEAFRQLQPRFPGLHLVLTGKIDDAYQLIKARVEREGIERVVFTDFIPDESLRWLYEHCQAYVFPSLSEGFGLPALEAMAHGAPLVSTNASCSPEVYGNGAHYFDPLNIDDIAQKIAEVLDNSKLQNDLIKRGRAQAAKYSWERMAKQTLAVYRQALGEE
jgi:glycosyltransferase involved in cell wall biosynthesis